MPNIDFKMELDTREFDKVFGDYMKFQKRLPADVINAKLYYIARRATVTTKHTDKGAIQAELNTPSREYPSAPLAAIIVNKQLANKNQKGLTGTKMSRAVQKLIRMRQRSINFVRAGWKNAIKELEQYLAISGELKYARRWQAKSRPDQSTMNKQMPKSSGLAIPCKVNQFNITRAYGEIQNNVGNPHSHDINLLDRVKMEGLQKAINLEAISMQEYVARKLNEKHSAIKG